jgi:ketosteroid isomerase-like protein
VNPLPIISRYIEASNAHDVEAIVDCFADNAIVRDESATQHGKIEIKRWATETIEKYKFHFKPLSTEEHGAKTILSMEVSGSFPGSPIALDYHFTIANDKIQSLIIDS